MRDPDTVARFTTLYDTYHSRVYAYAVSRAGRQFAEEVASETFCIAWRRFGELRGEPLPWLLGIARNLVRESYRARTRQEALLAELSGGVEPAAADVGDAVAERLELLRALFALSEDDRELLMLVAWHGLASGEAARVVGCSKATFFVRLHRARNRLEKAMAGPMSTRSHMLVPGREPSR